MPSIRIESVPLNVPENHKPVVGGCNGDEDLELIGIAFEAFETRMQEDLGWWEVITRSPGEHSIEVEAETVFAVVHGAGEVEHEGKRIAFAVGDLVTVPGGTSCVFRIRLAFHARYARTDTKQMFREFDRLVARVSSLPSPPRTGRFAEMDKELVLADDFVAGDTVVYLRAGGSSLFADLVPLPRSAARVSDWDLADLVLYNPHMSPYRERRVRCLAHDTQYPFRHCEELFIRRDGSWLRWVDDPTGQNLSAALPDLWPDAHARLREPSPLTRDEADELVQHVLATIDYAPGNETASMQWHLPEVTRKHGRISTLLIEPQLELSEGVLSRWGVHSYAARASFNVSSYTHIRLPRDVPAFGSFVAMALEISGRVFTEWEYRFERTAEGIVLVAKRLVNLGD